MKKLKHTALFFLLFMPAGYAQNSLANKLNIPALFSVSPFEKNKKKYPVPVKKITTIAAPANNFNSLIANLPFIKLKETATRKPVIFVTRFSLIDMLEGSINSVNDLLLNTYDDHIQELFKEAPSMVTVKCILSL